MSDIELYCFGESGNAYKAALMLEFCGVKWKPIWVDFFNGETRSDEFRSSVNEMGEVPILVHGPIKLTQSGVILEYLASHTQKLGGKSDEERREILRWILFDNHKLTGSIAPLRFLIQFAKSGETEVTEYLRRRAFGALNILNGHLAQQDFVIGKRLTIADLSLCGYLFYGDELPFSMAEYVHVENWLDRIKNHKGWKHPYDLMPMAKIV